MCTTDTTVNGCAVKRTQDFCIPLIVTSSVCAYRRARSAVGEPEVPGAPSITAQSLLSLAGNTDCLAVNTALGQRGTAGLCRSGESRHHFYDCGTLPDHSWCTYEVRHSYYYGTGAFDRQGATRTSTSA